MHSVVRLTLVLLVVFTAAPASGGRPARKVFAGSAVKDGLGGGIDLRVDRRWQESK